tara:strand:- start:1256 stop:1600 length:345 start_codon:yes stop_codon:yes gene_type:complete
MALKQVILIRKDLKLPKGKLAVQVAHASTDCALNSDKKVVEEWKSLGMKKVVLKVENLDELLKFKKQADKLGLVNSLIKDAGHTVVEPGTVTCLGIGPDEEEKIDKISGKLKCV